MIKIIAPIITFILLIYFVAHIWEKTNSKNKKKIAIIMGTTILLTFIGTAFLVIS